MQVQRVLDRGKMMPCLKAELQPRPRAGGAPTDIASFVAQAARQAKEDVRAREASLKAGLSGNLGLMALASMNQKSRSRRSTAMRCGTVRSWTTPCFP